MKKLLFSIIWLLLIQSSTLAADRYWVAPISGNWNDITNWSTSSGGIIGASVPTAGDFVYFDANSLGDCVLDVAAAFDGINTSGYSGTIDLNGFAFDPAVTGTDHCRFLGGTINDSPGTSEINYTTTGTSYFSSVVFGAILNIESDRIILDGGVFNAAVTMNQAGGSNAPGAGGCTFNGITAITNSGTGYLMLSNATPDIFNGELTLSNTGTSTIRIAQNGIGNLFNENIIVNSTSGGGIYFGDGGGTSTLALGKTISVGVDGFIDGELRLREFTQLGVTAQNLVLTADAILRIDNNSEFNGVLTFEAPRLLISESNFNEVTSIEKTGAATDYSNGLNTFAANTTLINTGSGSLVFGNGDPDSFQADLYLNNSGTSNIHLAYNSAGNTIDGDLTVLNSGSANYVYLSNTATSTLSIVGDVSVVSESTDANSAIYLGNSGSLIIGGRLDILQNSTGTNSYIYVANAASSTVEIDGTTTLENNGADNIRRAYFGSNGDVIFNDSLIIENNSTANASVVYLNHSTASTNLYNGHIVISNTLANGDGIYFGEAGGTGTLAATKEIIIGAGGFVDGILRFENFTQVGATAQTLELTVDARIIIDYCDWGGDLSITSPRIHIRENDFHGTTFMEKTGASDDNSYGGNTFDLDVELKNTGPNNFYMGNTDPDTFTLNLLLNNQSSGNIYIAGNSAGNYLGGNLTANNVGTGAGNAVISIANGASSSMTIEGDVILNNTGDADNNSTYFPSQGDLILNGNLTADHAPTGTNGYLYLANSTDASLIVNGTTNIDIGLTGGTTKRTYIAQSGTATFNGDITISNHSDATNNQVYLNTNATGYIDFVGDIILESTHFDGDGFLFGTNGGSALLEDTYTVTVGLGGFIAGDLYFRNFTQDGGTAQNITITGTGYFRQYDSDWGGNVDFRGARYYTRETHYRGTTYLEKSGASDDNSYGGNTFDFDVELKNTGSDNFVMGDNTADTFSQDVLMNNEGLANLYIANNSAGNYIGGDLTINNAGTGAGSAHVSVATGASATIIIDGDAVINNIGAAANNNAYFPSQGEIVLNGDLTIDHSPTGDNGYIYIANSTGAELTVNGITNIAVGLTGGTTKRTYIGQAGTSTFNGEFTLSNNSNATNNQVYIASNATGSVVFNGDMILESTHVDGDGVLFGISGGTSLLADTYTVTVGPGGYIAGDLYFRNFTQDGGTAQNITLTGTGYFRQYASDWGGNVDFISPRYYTRDTRYRGLTYIEKTGAVNDASDGGNIFDQNTTLRNTGSDYLLMGNGNFDLWDSNLIITNEGSGNLYIAHNSAGNIIGGDLEVNALTIGASSQTIYVSTGAASTLEIGGNTVVLNDADATNNNIILGDNGDIDFLGDLTITNSSISTNADIYLASNTNSAVRVEGSTTVNNTAVGGNSKQVFIGYNGDIVFNGSITLSNSSNATTSEISLNERGNSENFYNENIILNCSEITADGIYFGRYGGFGTLATGKTITIGPDDFLGEDLTFRNFTQLGSVAQTIEPTTAVTRIDNINSEWNGDVTFTSARYFSNYTLYNADATIHKVGSGNDNSTGGNTFNGITVIRNSGDGYLMPANSVGNDFNGNVTFEKVAAGLMYPAYNTISTFAADIIIDANDIITFGAAGNGRIEMDGTIAQSISIVGAAPMPRFRDLQTNNPTDEITLNTPIEIITELDLDLGNINTTMVNMLFMTDNSIVSSVSDDAFVDGPVTKVGNDIFIFPVGKIDVYRPIELATAPASGSAQFRAEYFPIDVVIDGIPDVPVEPAIHHISNCEYWILDRVVSSNSVVVGLYYKDFSPENCSGVENQADLLVSRWSGAIWEDHGNGGFGGVPEDGWVRSFSPITTFSPFTIATTTGLNPLPIELINFAVSKQESNALIEWTTKSELNNDYFEIEHSVDGITFETIAQIDGAGNSNATLNYEFLDRNPTPGINYYRLKQVDFDGEFSFSKTQSVEFNSLAHVKVYPNPMTNDNDLIITANHPITLIEMLNETGQMIYQSEVFDHLNQITVNNSTLVPGMYYVKIYTASGVNIEKLIVQ